MTFSEYDIVKSQYTVAEQFEDLKKFKKNLMYIRIF